MYPSTEEINEAIEDLVRMGLLSRWWCDVCNDYVPYRTLEMTEKQSRRKHNRTHAVTSGGH